MFMFSSFKNYTNEDVIRMLEKNGVKEDIRLIPAVIGGDEELRHGVVLAKSNIAKQFGIKTGETIYQAKKKCPQIRIFPTKHELYKEYSASIFMEWVYLQYAVI